MQVSSIGLIEIMERYRKLYLPAVTDILDAEGYTNQWLGKEIKPLRPEMKIVGEAFTVRWEPDPGRQGADAAKEDTNMLEMLTANKAVVVDSGGNDRCGLWGAMSAIRARLKGIAGIVVDGNVRDTAHIVEQGFPVFAKSTSPLDALGHSKIKGGEIPVTINSVIVTPGDIIFGDIDGVVCIPRAIAEDVLKKAEALVANETKIRAELLNGASSTAVREKYGHF